MKNIEGLYYSKEHEWLKVEGTTATVGVTDYAQAALGDIVFVELPEVDEDYEKDGTIGVVESVKAASDIYIPVACTVTEVNEELEDAPELLNENAFANWICKIEISDATELEELMSCAEYVEYCTEQ